MKFLKSDLAASSNESGGCLYMMDEVGKPGRRKQPLSSIKISTRFRTTRSRWRRGLELLLHHVIMLLVLDSLIVPNIDFGENNKNQNNALPPESQRNPNAGLIGLAQAVQHLNLLPNVLRGPAFIKSMDSEHVHENTPVNKHVYTLQAVTESAGDQDVRIEYAIEGTQLFGLEDRSSGRVRVMQLIDREQTGDSVSFQVVATPYLYNRPGAQTRLNITVYILDENDNAPRFERVQVGNQVYDSQALRGQTQRASFQSSLSSWNAASSKTSPPVIRLNLSEDKPVRSVVVDLIEAIDLDKVSSSPLSATCLECEPQFKLVPRTANSLNDRLEWSIELVEQLVHMPKNNQRLLNVIVSDGKFNSSLEFEITIDDVQNRPPHFISSTTCAIQENTPIDRTILQLEAIDGDALALEGGPIVSSIGNKTNSAAASYSGRQIVYDFFDTTSGRSASRQYDFKLHPLTGQLQVAQRLDREAYLEQGGVLAMQVRARELTVDTGTLAVAGEDVYDSILAKVAPFIDPTQAVTISEITVIVLDVNDNSPRWLNSSEIAQMSRASIWHQRLPSDRDFGRNYQIRVRENSLPGSPLTNRNEMFVYDLDAGNNAEFTIKLDDPFNLFDVEPKRVSGFSSVTLKLAKLSPGDTRKTVLDYENINERNYIVQLYAQEIGTNEQFKSKAQIQVSVIDVNDNAPEFKEVAYVANIREDIAPGKLFKVVQATDRDESSKQLRYSLHGQSAYLFNIDPMRGAITVAKCEQPQQRPAANRRTSQTNSNNHQQQPHRSCIDFETQKVHHLMVEVSDGELSSKVPLQVFVEDASDNAPVFALPIVDVVIEEGQERLEPPIRIEASDVDQSSTLSYSIVEGNFEGFFAINNATGELQLTRAIRIPHDDLSSPPVAHGLGDPMPFNQASRLQYNKITLIVQASDGQHTTNGTIRIDILDANDNAPQFSRQRYEHEINEQAQAGQSVLQVKAYDSDRGNNARVSYRLERGSHNQFDIDELTGEISVAREARPFDVAKRDNYTLEVVAYDHGLVSKSSSAIVVIKVVGATLRAPEFSPQVQRVTVNENTLNNTIIYRMLVKEQQQQQLTLNQMALMFEPGPVEGLDKNGQPVGELERLESMLSVSQNTGDIVVASGLNHDLVAYINLTLYVSYRPVSSPLEELAAANAPLPPPPSPYSEPLSSELASQRVRSVGYLLVNVVDDNEHAPMFAAPWTQSQPELTFQMLEELPAGSILTQLVASDADSKISHYEISPPNEYFELSSPQSGVIVNRKPIDYDTLMRQTFLSPGAHHRAGSSSTTASSLQSAALQMAPQGQGNNVIQFNVIVYDSGLRQLSAKAIVSVEILPINDNECKFERQLYEVSLKENALPDTVVTQVRASDLDFGEEHNSITYQLLGEQRDLFQIDARTGVVTVSPRGSIGLDREQLAQPLISLTVVGRDDRQVAPAGGGGHSQSRAKPADSLGGRSCSTTLRVLVDDVNDNPPLFAQKVYETTVYDTDTVDVPLIKLIVHDEDAKFSNLSTARNAAAAGASQQSVAAMSQNSFRILSGNINDSFNITPSGMIYVTRPLNETWPMLARGGASNSSNLIVSQPIELKVQVRQQSSSSSSTAAANLQAGQLQASVQQHPLPAQFTDECLVRVTVMKINRYAPEWRFESNRPVVIEENSRPGSLVTQLRCVDRDYELKSGPTASLSSHHNHFDSRQSAGRVRQTPLTTASLDPAAASPIRYWIKENGANVLETSEFRLDSVSGNLISRVELDRERREFYQLIVACEDNGKPQSLESITSLFVRVLDVDDNKPEFELPIRQPNAILSARSNSHSTPRTTPTTITFVIEEQQSKGLQVGELRAVDRDLDQTHPISYCLLEGNEFQEFALDEQTGVLYTNQTLDRERQSHYELLVKAINDGQSCETHLALHVASSAAVNATRPVGASVIKSASDQSLLKVRVELQDINDNAPLFPLNTYRAGVHHRAAWGTLVTQVKAFDPDHELNGTLTYKINEILLYKIQPPVASTRNHQRTGHLSDNSIHYQPMASSVAAAKPIKLIQLPFKIDQDGNVYTQQLLTQYQLMSMFVLQIEATERSEPWRTVATKLEIYIYETNQQLRVKINLNPRFIEAYQHEVESLLSNATKYTAIINRARSYDGTSSHEYQSKSIAAKGPLMGSRSSRAAAAAAATASPTPVPMLDLSQLNSSQAQVNLAHQRTNLQVAVVPWWQAFSEPHQSSTIHAVFVDNHRLVNPHLVMEKFDLTSAQLLLSAHQMAADQRQPVLQDGNANELVHPLIDHVALASSVLAAEQQAGNAFGLAGIDWLESPSVLFLCLSLMLMLIGLVICLIGCCCTSRIKDHIIKSALDKLAKQQALQAKINERVLAATNQAVYGNGSVSHQLDGAEFMQTQGAGFMSSFDATKGCLNNNYENMSILQRAMEAGEFFDPNYTTLSANGNDANNNAGHLNLAAHYYDASELENQQNGGGQEAAHCQYQPMDQSVVSLSLEDEEDDDDDDEGDEGNQRRQVAADGNNYDLLGHKSQAASNGADLTNDGHHQHQQMVSAKSKLYTNNSNGVVSSHSRLRQQIPSNQQNL